MPQWRVFTYILEFNRWGCLIQLARLGSGWTGTVQVGLPVPSGIALWNPSVRSCTELENPVCWNTLSVYCAIYDPLVRLNPFLLKVYLAQHLTSCYCISTCLSSCGCFRVSSVSFHVNNCFSEYPLSATHRLLTIETIIHQPWSWLGTANNSI